MIHPCTRLQYINDEIGYGVFATEAIPKGTIIYTKDDLEIEISSEEYNRYNPEMKEQIEKYTYRNEKGVRIMSWDFAKYVNHCCDSNTLSTSYEFDLVIRDIMPGEEITCDYGILNVEHEMPLVCQRTGCRNLLKPSDFEALHKKWDEKVKVALSCFTKVDQPLLPFFNHKNMDELLEYFHDKRKYKPVISMRYYETKRAVQLS